MGWISFKKKKCDFFLSSFLQMHKHNSISSVHTTWYGVVSHSIELYKKPAGHKGNFYCYHYKPIPLKRKAKQNRYSNWKENLATTNDRSEISFSQSEANDTHIQRFHQEWILANTRIIRFLSHFLSVSWKNSFYSSSQPK